MTMQQIEQRIAKEQNDYNAEIHDGKLPANLLELFKRAFMTALPMSHKLPPSVIKNIVSKKVSELTRLEVRQVLNLIIATPPEKLYKDFDIALKGFETIANLMMDCNLEVKKKEAEWNETKASLIRLSGIDVNGRKPQLYQA